MRVAFLGLGIMGSRMAANLVRAGHELTVWTRTPGKAQAWADEHRAAVAATPREAADGAEVVVSMVVDGAQVRSVLLGEDGAADGAGDGTLVVDMSTIAPADARSIAADLEARGLRFVDAPVTGSSPKAADGTLTIMCGGAADDVDRARPLFDVMGELVVHVGATGQGQALKLVNNATAAANAATVAQALLVADALGVDLDALQAVLGAGSGGSAMLALKAAPMRDHDFSTLFKAEHMLKDVRLCLEEAQSAGVPFPAAAAARDALVAAMGRGRGDADFAVLLEAFEGLAGRRLGDGPAGPDGPSGD
ncbi:NAD(P)-dependent oxidoreductase [Conexibacter sp. SYSU D00693]|uniref:NAD(P)-dependent oxidoreductase n=1 Tax=Conexibacter sp. SYSU D00693 TaxID=2812560 RepID=UPI00196B897D|nr:NAD(P)-dependent oxidoreductase [Conexibacter sp. SYSU D00693]